ncbi:MAG: hypothetical protein MUC50_07460 [Myxococcota bacterium]|nr:hypothetical protein [Myxococcota bacterium]
MDEQVFDAEAFARFDLNAGEIRSAEDGVLLMLPPEVAAGITPSPAVSRASREWGLLHGRGLRSALDIRGGQAGMELLSQHLCGTVATLGFGRLSIEVYGNALLLRVPRSGPVLSSKGLAEVFTSFVAGYLEGLSDHSFEVAPLGAAGESILLLASNEQAAVAAARFAQAGESAMNIVQKMSSWSVA